MTPSQGQPSPDISHYQDLMMNVVYNVCSIVTMPVEMALRPQYGTRYFSPVTQFFTSVMMMLLPVFSAMADSFSRFLPFGFHGLNGIFGIGSLSKLYFAAGFLHGLRIWRRMIHMDREEHSYWEGAALPIFNILPGSFWIVRIIYEPIFVIIVALVLGNLFILQGSAAHYLELAAVMLAMKQYVAWFARWQFLRDLMDARNAGPLIARAVDNRASEEELSAIHVATIRNLPDDQRAAFTSHIARSIYKEA
jgi:hypothetical protein